MPLSDAEVEAVKAATPDLQHLGLQGCVKALVHFASLVRWPLIGPESGAKRGPGDEGDNG